MLVEYFEELVETALQEVVQPLNQLDPDTPYCSLVHTPIQSPHHSPLKIMAHVNTNQPQQPAWRARSPLNWAPPLHDLPQAFEKMLPKFDPSEKILVDDHLQIFYLAIEALRVGEHEDVEIVSTYPERSRSLMVFFSSCKFNHRLGHI